MTETKGSTILVTGGAGYVGSHTVFLLLNLNHPVVVVDNCSETMMHEIDSNGNLEELPESLRRVEQLANQKLAAFYKINLVSDKEKLDDIFRRHNIRAIIHFAALKSVSESINLPLEYYTNNLIGTINLLNIMKRNGCRNLIFSSSATVYGLPQYMPVDEKHQVGMNILNPYGRTKFMIEQMLQDLCKTNSDGSATSVTQQHQTNDCCWNIISLRYFNPVGAHPSGYIGEHTQGVPNNLMPYISQVSIGKRDKLYVFGNDFETVDGTGVRDYIHIMDLASGHINALDYLLKRCANQENSSTAAATTTTSGGSSSNSEQLGYKVYNLGTGKGYSVLEVIKTFEQINNVKIPFEITGRREGDAGEVYADAKLALQELGWSARHSLVDMCRDTYRWQSTHPDGFKTACPAKQLSEAGKTIFSTDLELKETSKE